VSCVTRWLSNRVSIQCTRVSFVQTLLVSFSWSCRAVAPPPAKIPWGSTTQDGRICAQRFRCEQRLTAHFNWQTSIQAIYCTSNFMRSSQVSTHDTRFSNSRHGRIVETSEVPCHEPSVEKYSSDVSSCGHSIFCGAVL